MITILNIILMQDRLLSNNFRDHVGTNLIDARSDRSCVVTVVVSKDINCGTECYEFYEWSVKHKRQSEMF